MSAPQSLRVGKGVEVWMGKTACRELYDYIEPLLLEVYGEDSDVAGWFIASDCFGTLDITPYSSADFQAVSGWILEAAKQGQYAREHLNELKAALEADPRFKRN